MNERQQEKDHKRASHRISHPEAGRANRLGPKCQNSASVERVASASIFSNFLEDFQEDTPAKIPLCDAERMLESGGKQRIGDFPLCSEKLRQGKVANLAKKKKKKKISRAQQYRLKVQVQGRNMNRSRDVTKGNRYIFCNFKPNCYHYQYSPSAP